MPKAKELRPFVERIITIAKRGLPAGDANASTLHARRLVLRDIQDRDVVSKLFDTIAPRFEARPGGYTRILRLGYRRGDSAEVAQIELVGSEYNPNAETEKTRRRERPSKPKGVGGRLRAAAERLRGKKAEAGDGEAAEGDAPAKKAKPARAKSEVRQVRHPRQGQDDGRPRKAGGS